MYDSDSEKEIRKETSKSSRTLAVCSYVYENGCRLVCGPSFCGLDFLISQLCEGHLISNCISFLTVCLNTLTQPSEQPVRAFFSFLFFEINDSHGTRANVSNWIWIQRYVPKTNSPHNKTKNIEKEI